MTETSPADATSTDAASTDAASAVGAATGAGKSAGGGGGGGESDAGGARVYRAQRQDKPWGEELIFATGEDGYVAKIIEVRAGESLSLQYHRAKVETITVVAGVARVEYGAHEQYLRTVDLSEGDVIHLPAGARHRIAAVEDVTFVEASTAYPGWREDVVRLEDRYGRGGTSAP